jgi:hypothetical protein
MAQCRLQRLPERFGTIPIEPCTDRTEARRWLPIHPIVGALLRQGKLRGVVA